jgi:hypothetical protein
MFQRRDNIEIEHHLLVAHVVVLLFAGEKLFLRAMQKSQIAKKKKESSKRGIEPAPFAQERTSVTKQTEGVIHRMDGQRAI